jgi:hypothetical protein
LNKYLRYTLKGLAILAGFFLLLFLAAYIYLSANKKEIIDKVKTEIAEKLNGDVQIGNISLTFLQNFPNISVLIENVSIHDTMFRQHRHPFFKAEKVYAAISMVNVIRKNNPLSGIRVDNGQLYVYTDTTGYTNAYLFAPKKKETIDKKKSPAKTEIESVKLRQVRFIMNNLQKEKLYDFDVNKLNCKIKNKDSSLILATSTDILIHSLAFKTPLGSFAKESTFEGDFDLNFDKAKKQLSFSDMKIDLKGQQFVFTGQFNFKENPTFQLKILTDDLDYDLAQSLVTEKIRKALSLVKLNKQVQDVVTELSGNLKGGGDPLVKVSWKISDTDVHSPFASLTNCSLSGYFLNEIVPGLPRKDPNSRLHFENVEGKFQGIKVKSKEVFIDDLVKSMVKCDIKSEFDLAQLNEIIGSNAIHLHDGTGILDLTYSGPLKENSNQNTTVNGSISFKNGLLAYHPREIEVKSVSGKIVFKNTNVSVENFQGSVYGNKIVMNGSAKNLLALVRTNPGKILIDWNIYSPALNLNNFTSLLKKRETATRTRKKTRLGGIGNDLDEIVEYGNFHLNVKADKLTYSKFTATGVTASVGLINENWLLNNVNLQHGGGAMTVSGSFNEKNSNFYEAAVSVSMNNVDVSKVMYAFDDFGQDGISYENLKGKVASNADVSLDIDRNVLKPSNLNGIVSFSIKNGALLNYEPLKKVQKVVFKKRNFDEIYFAELKDKIEIRDKVIKINRMEIQSTVITLFVEGIYDLQGTTTDIGIQVPISNIKKRDEDFVLENKGAEAKGGASIFVRGRPGPDGKISFKLDLFRKFRKDKKEESILATADSTGQEVKQTAKERRQERKEKRAAKKEAKKAVALKEEEN